MAKPITIYGRILSPFCARVALAARAKGLPYKLSMPPEGGLKGEAYLKMNPLGKAPVIKDGGVTLFESGVIVDYLDAKSRAKKLLPSAPSKAAAIRLVGAVAAEYVQMPALDLYRVKRGIAQGPIDTGAATESLHKGLAALEQICPRAKFAGGAKFSHADCFVAPALLFATGATQAFGQGDVLAGYPKLRKYWSGIRKDKIAKPVLDEMTTMMEDAFAGRLPPMK